MTSGVYKITSPSGNFYVGSSVNIEGRWAVHRSGLRRKNHHCEPLQRAAEKYGADSFVFDILVICATNDLEMYEQRFIDALRPVYNVCTTAYRPQGNPNLRVAIIKRNRTWEWTEDAKKALSDAAKKRGAPNKGKPMSVEQKAKLSAAMKGRKLSPEHKAKLAENCRKQNEIRFGKKA